jgi:hypothetical protein
MTNRQLFEQRTGGAPCNSCHTRIDGLGFGFEHYDERGVYLERDEGLPVDATGTLIGTDVDGAYDGAIELSERMASSRSVQSCATQRWFRFAAGRAPEERDACVLSNLQTRLRQTDGDIRELMVALITSPEMRSRPSATETP